MLETRISGCVVCVLYTCTSDYFSFIWHGFCKYFSSWCLSLHPDACLCIPMARSAENKAPPAVESDGRGHNSSLWHPGPSNCWPHQQSVAFAVRPSITLEVFRQSKDCRSGPQATWVSAFKESGINVLKLFKNTVTIYIVHCSCFKILAHRSTSLIPTNPTHRFCCWNFVKKPRAPEQAKLVRRSLRSHPLSMEFMSLVAVAKDSAPVVEGCMMCQLNSTDVNLFSASKCMQ